MASTTDPRVSWNNGGEKPKRGRPKKPIDLEMVERLATIQCTQSEIATALGVSVDTLQRNEHFAATYKKGSEGGKKSLRRMQFESANRGNVAMQIFLGKNYLGQTDKGALEVVNAPTPPEARADQLLAWFRQTSPTELNEALRLVAKQYGLPFPDRDEPSPQKAIVPASYTVEQD